VSGRTRNPGWVSAFRKYAAAVRIQSKHAEEDPDGTGIPLKMWTSQVRVLDQIIDGLQNGIHIFYVLKSRQLGVTTVTLLLLLFWAAWHPNTILCQVSDDEKQSNKNRITIRSYLNSLVGFMGKSFRITRDNRMGFEFSNGSRIDLLVAGKTKISWGEGEGYLGGVLTEVASYGKEEGLDSFRHAMAPENPRALYIFESTAHGPNHWKDMWDAAMKDEFSSRCIFVGWWSNDLQRIKITDRRYRMFGNEQPSPEEWDRIRLVKDRYGFDITMEQLAWYRWQQSQPSSGVADMSQNQPWYAEECFVFSGISFFQVRLVADRREQITSAPAELAVEDGGFIFQGYSFYLGDEYHLSRVEKLDSARSSIDVVRLRVWEHPQPDGWYAIGVDPAFGRDDRNNNHAVSIWRCFADKIVQVAEWADNIPDTRNCAWVIAYVAGQYQNCRINIDMTGGPGQAVMQEFDNLRNRMRSELYQTELRRLAEKEKAENEARRLSGDPEETGRIGHNSGPGWSFEDFLPAANWYMYRRIDSPGPGFVYNSKIGRDLKFRMMNAYRDSWKSNLLEIRSVPLLDEMAIVRQEASDIGAAAPGRQRDDRTFASALANLTWIENLRPALIANGITWEGARKKAAGEVSAVGEILTHRVYSILRAQAEIDEGPPAKSFFEARGLLA